MIEKTLFFPIELFTKSMFLLEIGILENLTIDRNSYEIDTYRVFKFDSLIWPAVELMVYRMYKLDINSYQTQIKS
jgi:cAMP phosphodiesterase